jgi:hypothetical protein
MKKVTGISAIFGKLSNENEIMSYLCLYFILTHPLHLTVLPPLYSGREGNGRLADVGVSTFKIRQ